jgi:hypothetical protein
MKFIIKCVQNQNVRHVQFKLFKNQMFHATWCSKANDKKGCNFKDCHVLSSIINQFFKSIINNK